MSHVPAVPAVFEASLIKVHAVPAVVCYFSRLLLFFVLAGVFCN